MSLSDLYIDNTPENSDIVYVYLVVTDTNNVTQFVVLGYDSNYNTNITNVYNSIKDICSVVYNQSNYETYFSKNKFNKLLYVVINQYVNSNNQDCYMYLRFDSNNNIDYYDSNLLEFAPEKYPLDKGNNDRVVHKYLTL